MPGGVFERIVCGVDGSPASLEAVRQSDVLLEPDGTLLLVAVVDLLQAVSFRVAPTALHAARHVLDEVEKLDEAASAALAQALEKVDRADRVQTLETEGRPASRLLDVVASEQATLLVVGTHGLGRAAGVLLGSVATRMLHQSPCSVLVARPSAGGAWSPRTIVVGVDGSSAAEDALRTARELEQRFDAEVRVSTAAGRAAHTLVEEAAEADLLIVGSGGAHHGLSLGSVSERVAHHASCSVLVVRAAHPADD